MVGHNERARSPQNAHADLALALSKTGLEMLLVLQGAGFEILRDPQDLLTLQILSLGIGKANGGHLPTMLKLIGEIVDKLDVSPLEELIEQAKDTR